MDERHYRDSMRPGLDHRRARLLSRLASMLALICLIPPGGLRAQIPADEFHRDCLFCHESDSQADPALLLPEPQVCIVCHAPHNDHPVAVRPVNADVHPSLPLTNGLVTCITCHDQHSPQPLQLRLPASQLCLSCHNR